MSQNQNFSLELAKQLYHSDKQFPIDFDNAWVWLGYSKKDKALKVLKSKFIEGEDFALLQEGEWTQQGRSSDSYGLSINCFKEMGMMAGTDKGRQIRKYFIECERIAKTALIQQPQSTAEMLLMFAQQMVENERQLKEQANRLSAIEEENQLLKEQVEAVDMETLANTAELERFRNGHGFWFSVAGWCSKHGIKKPVQWMTIQGRKAAALCRAKGIQPVRVSDPRYGTVNTYPDSILSELTWD